MRAASLNHVYRLVWNSVTQAWVVVSEITKSKGKSKSQKAAQVVTSAMLAGFAGLAVAGPEGGVVTGGNGTINQDGAVTTINQSSQTLNINWDSFNVGRHEVVNFIQPSTTALAVNQILDTNGSRILGNINANGQVWLINPNGIYFGQGAQINVGSLLASTLNPLGNTTTNGTQVFGNGGTGSVINEGTINAANGGYVALIANSVSNTGTIVANNGAVALGAGSQVSVTFADNQLLSLTVDQSTLNNLAENKGLIQANGGVALLSAGAKDSLLASVVNNEGVIEAKTVDHKEGKIILLGGMAAGTAKVAGTLDASAQTGNGGFIETSAAHVKVADSAKVTTKAENLDGGNGETGKWLIDPVDFTVDASGGDMTGAAVSFALLQNNFEIQSTKGKQGTNGDILINDAISWSTNHNLLLTAIRNIFINKTITSTGENGKLFLQYAQGDSTGTYYINAKVNLHEGKNFLTRNGLGATTLYNVITSLGDVNSVTGNDLQGMQGNLNAAYALGADIDASATSVWNGGRGFTPIGNNNASFDGAFEGLNHTIKNLTINRPNEQRVGLFGTNNYAGVMQNVGLINANITGDSYVGAFLGSGTVRNFKNIYSVDGVVSGIYSVGGLFGQIVGGSIESSYVDGGSVNGSERQSATGLTNQFIGGVAGNIQISTIINTYTSAQVSGVDDVGGLVGAVYGSQYNGSSIQNTYSNGRVFGSGVRVGGLIGTVNNAYGVSTISNSFWNIDASGMVSSAAGTGVNATQSKTISTYKNAGWDISAQGGENTVWRIYDGQTAPLLRRFMPTLTVLPSYDGSGAYLENIGAFTAVGSYDASKVFFSNTNLLNLSSNAAGSYTASIAVEGYSNQQGYDIVVSNRNISTPGSASGEIKINNGINWNNGILNISGNVTNPGQINSNNGVFNLQNGTWNQVDPYFNASFNVKDFRIAGGTFKRFLGGDGTSASPYQIYDIYGLQGIDSVGMLSQNFVLTNDINAATVTSWNTNAGFKPIGVNSDYSNSRGFSGIFNGFGHTINDLTINLPSTDYVGLFGYTNGATIQNIGLVGGAVSARNFVSGLVGFNQNSTISNAYANVTVTGSDNVGGVVGVNYNNATISNSYATGTVTGDANVGGLVGGNYNNSTISNSYATGTVTGLTVVGGLVGYDNSNNALIINSYYSQSTGRNDTGKGIRKTTDEMKQLATFAGWDIDAQGGTTTAWRIYEGQTEPMLRSFMQPLYVGVVTPTYDGTGNHLSNLGAYTYAASNYDTSKVFGSLTIDLIGNAEALNLTSNGKDSYVAAVSGTFSTQGLYSNQNYDLIGVSNHKLISTPGSAAGEIRLPNGISWTNGTLNINGNVTNAGAISSSNGVFNLQSGSWNQVGSNLAAFSVNDFRISGGTFVRAVDGNGTAANPYDLVDIYGLKGIQSAPTYAYTLLNDIDASTASNWNAGTGFGMLGNFTGSFDGLNHTLSNFTINLPTTDKVGLFSSTNNAVIKNIRLANANVTGNNFVGGLVGYATNTNISNSSVTGVVAGATSNSGWIGGLVGNQSGGSVAGSYTSGSVTGVVRVGGLIGSTTGNVSDSYSNSTVNASAGLAGGLIGSGTGLSTTVQRSYASGKVNATNQAGGLVGSFSGTITNSYWNKDTSGKSNAAGSGTVTGVTGLTSAEMADTSKFINAGWNASGAGGDGTTWRLYEGGNGPLLRSFLKQLYVYSDFDGTADTVNSFNGYQVVGSYDSSKLLGTPNNTLILSSNNAGSYNATVGGLYSTQDGYDIIGRTIATPGSAQGEVTLANGIHWNNGTLSVYGKLVNSGAIDWSNGTLNLFGGMGHNGTISWTDGTLNLSGNITNPGDISSINGQLNINGNWTEISNQLSNLNVNNWKIGSGFTFIRALGGDGTAANPYQLTDVYGLQGVNSSGMLAKNYILANDIDASATSIWNSGAGFESLGNATTKFTGVFDGNSNVISYLTINRPTSSNIGLFGYTNNATIRNLGLTDVDVAGNSYVGGMIGRASQTNISNSFVTGNVSGKYYVKLPNTASARIAETLNVGGMVGLLEQGSLLTNSYANAYVKSDTPDVIYDPVAGWVTPITTSVVVGGVVGQNTGSVISNSYFTGQIQTINNNEYQVGAITGRNGGTLLNNFANASNSSDNTVLTASLSPAMQTTSNYKNAGWSISDNGGENTIWRIYEGQTGPMLRSFMSQANLGTVTKHYNGQVQNASGAIAGLDASHVFGTAATGTNAGTYTSNYYSDQLGYDFSGGDLIIDPTRLNILNVGGTRVYDGTVVFNSGVLTLDGLVNGETLNLSGYGTVADKNVGINKTLDVSHLGLGNGTGLASNYTFDGGLHLVNITAKSLAVTADAANKTYDGNNTATVTLTTSDMVAGDKLTIGNASATFSDKNAAYNKTVTVNGIVLSGDDARNYALQNTIATDTANIDKKALTVSGTTANDKTYDGKTTAVATAGNVSGFVGNETLNVSIRSANFGDKNAGKDKAVAVSYALADGSNGGLSSNYSLADSVVFADINKAILTYVANAASTTSANMIAGRTPILSGSVIGFVEGETLQNATTGNLVWSTNASRLAGKYAITGSGLSAENYDFVQAVTNNTALTVRVK